MANPGWTFNPLDPDQDFWFRTLPEPSAVDRLAAVGDPLCSAAERCRDYDEQAERQAEDRAVVERLAGAKARYTFQVDVADYYKRKLRGDPDARAHFRAVRRAG